MAPKVRKKDAVCMPLWWKAYYSTIVCSPLDDGFMALFLIASAEYYKCFTHLQAYPTMI